MRILSIITCFGRGGAEVLVRSLTEEWRDLGHECAVLSFTGAKTIGASVENEMAMRQHLEEIGADAETLGLKNRKNLFLAALRFRKLLARWKPDVIHAHTAKGVLIAAGASCPIFYTHHTSKVSFNPKIFFLLDRIATGHIAIGDQCRDLLARHTRLPITLIPNAVRPPSGQPEKRTLGEKAIVAMVGNLRPEKNYAILGDIILALERLLPPGKMPHFEVAGAGSSAMVQSRLDAAGVSDHVTFLGATDGPDELFSRSSLMLNCSVQEGLPVTMIEAALSGLPIVAPRLGDIPMIVRPAQSGILTKVGDTSAMAEAIAGIISSKERYVALSAGARAVGAEFDIRKCAKAHLELYVS